MKSVLLSILLVSFNVFAESVVTSITPVSVATPEAVFSQEIEVKMICDYVTGSYSCGEYGHSSCTYEGYSCPIQEAKNQLKTMFSDKIISIVAVDELSATVWFHGPNEAIKNELNTVKLKVTYLK